MLLFELPLAIKHNIVLHNLPTSNEYIYILSIYEINLPCLKRQVNQYNNVEFDDTPHYEWV
jgi:hypothetical protein